MVSTGLEPSERVAVIVTGIMASISTLSVTLLLLHIVSVTIIPLLWRSMSHTHIEDVQDERVFLKTHLGIFVVFLLCSDLVQGISGYFQFIWAIEGRVSEGSLCTAQAAMLLFGDNGSAIWATVISFHTVLTVVGGKRIPASVVTALVLGGWALIGILTLIGPLAIETNVRGPFYGVAGAWCFVTSKYKMARIFVHYLPILLSASLIAVNYTLVALVLSRILVRQDRTWRFVAPFCRQDVSPYHWHQPEPPVSGLVSHSGQDSRTQSSGSGVDEGTSKVPRWQGTVQNINSSVTKDTIQDIESTIGGSHNGGSVVPTIRTRQPPIPRSQAQFKTLALKMLWYPIGYIALVLPIACSRLNFNNSPSRPVMLAFMCLLWSMGMVNVIIYVTTRRVGRSPVLRNRSRLLGKASQDKTKPGNAIQILVDRHTTEDHVVGLSTRPGSCSDRGSPQHLCFDPSDASLTFPTNSFHLPTGATDGDMEAQSMSWPEPLGKTEKIGIAM